MLKSMGVLVAVVSLAGCAGFAAPAPVTVGVMQDIEHTCPVGGVVTIQVTKTPMGANEASVSCQYEKKNQGVAQNNPMDKLRS